MAYIDRIEEPELPSLELDNRQRWLLANIVGSLVGKLREEGAQADAALMAEYSPDTPPHPVVPGQ